MADALMVLASRDRPELMIVSDESRSPDGSVSGLNRRVDRTASQLGRETPEIECLLFDLSALEDQGVFVNVDVRNFGLLDRRLDWRALGVTLPRAGEFAFRSPRHGLVPDRFRLPLLRPADQAHTVLHKYSHHFGLVETVFETSAWRWVPWTAWSEFEHQFGRTQARLRRALEMYEANYDAVRDATVETFRRLAADSARRLEATGHSVPPDFEDAVVHEVMATQPSPALLRERLSLRYRIGVMQLGSEFLAEQRLAAEERRRLQQIDSENRLEEQQQQIRQRVVQEELWVVQERNRRQLQAEELERRREADIKERLRQLKLEAARERLQEALSPLEEGAKQLHAVVFEAATAIRTSLQKHQALHGSSAKKARELSRWFRLMDWQGDEQLEVLVRELEQLASMPISKKRKRAPGPLDQVLGDIIALTYADARALAEPSRMAALEL